MGGVLFWFSYAWEDSSVLGKYKYKAGNLPMLPVLVCSCSFAPGWCESMVGGAHCRVAMCCFSVWLVPSPHSLSDVVILLIGFFVTV